MGSKFILSTDTSCDVFRNELDKDNIPWVPLTFTIGETEYEDNFTMDSEYSEFYSKVRNGAMPTTSQINVFAHEEFFKSIIEKSNMDIVHLTLSSGLSNTYSSALIAAKNVMAQFPGINIEIVDSLSATLGHNFVLDEGVRFRNEGLSSRIAAEKLRDFALCVHHWIIVDDLMHLKRGGRVSGASAYIGTLLKVKPVLIINNEGRLAVVKKAVGTLKAFSYVLDMIKEHYAGGDEKVFYLASADGSDKLEEMKKILTDSFPSCRIKSGWIGPVIGAHTGAGTLGVVFLGKSRLKNT